MVHQVGRTCLSFALWLRVSIVHYWTVVFLSCKGVLPFELRVSIVHYWTVMLLSCRGVLPLGHTLLNFANAKLQKIFENKEFFTLMIVKRKELFLKEGQTHYYIYDSSFGSKLSVTSKSVIFFTHPNPHPQWWYKPHLK